LTFAFKGQGCSRLTEIALGGNPNGPKERQGEYTKPRREPNVIGFKKTSGTAFITYLFIFPINGEKTRKSDARKLGVSSRAENIHDTTALRNGFLVRRR